MPVKNSITTKLNCYHCGEDCENDHIKIEEKKFCCEGCKMVYEIINQNGLCTYYDGETSPGIPQKIKVREGKFAFLDKHEIAAKLIHFSEGNTKHIIFYLPQMHCSSCIWLLEHLSKLHTGIISSQVNFLKREITLVFNAELVSLKVIAELLSSIGYEPHISLNDISTSKVSKYDKARLYKIGIAGFCFGNIMMLSFPEYFSSGAEDGFLKTMFSYINLGLSLPVFFYCASEFFISAYKSLKQKFLNIDAPIALAIVITFCRSIYEIIGGYGPGYLDSMSGIVFFMLIGRFFQNKSYQTINFERDYTSYFPLGVTILSDKGVETQIPVSEIKKGMRIKIHSGEIVPADGILFLGKAKIDYSFVTGESLAIEKTIGELIYAGGKQTSGAIELEVIKEVSQSYLTQLWNNAVFKKKKNQSKDSFVHLLSRYFTYVLFTIALSAGIYWAYANNSSLAWNSVISVLIVACPCALLLSATFTNGNMISVLSRFKLYVKNATVLENIASIDTIVFDKTGTITRQQESPAVFKGCVLNNYQFQLIRSLASQSSHPLSRAIVAALPYQKPLTVVNYVEEPGKGSHAIINGESLRLGSSEFVTGEVSKTQVDGSKVYVALNEQVLGWFYIKTVYRDELAEVISSLKKTYKLAVISGDNNAEESYLRNIFGAEATLLFNKQPQDKLNFIQNLQNKGCKVIMIGDGLNDAGALQQSDIGIAISDNVNNFSPGSDIIIDGTMFSKLNKLLNFCRKEKTIIYGSFIVSILYNIVGLSFAVQGTLSPVVAAVLMPASSLSIVLYTYASSWYYSKKIKS